MFITVQDNDSPLAKDPNHQTNTDVGVSTESAVTRRRDLKDIRSDVSVSSAPSKSAKHPCGDVSGTRSTQTSLPLALYAL